MDFFCAHVGLRCLSLEQQHQHELLIYLDLLIELYDLVS